jgi:hypothetical protein
MNDPENHVNYDCYSTHSPRYQRIDRIKREDWILIAQIGKSNQEVPNQNRRAMPYSQFRLLAQFMNDQKMSSANNQRNNQIPKP